MQFVWQWKCVSGHRHGDMLWKTIDATIDVLHFLAMHKAWPDLLSRMKNNQMSVIHDRDLVVASRTWFCLYLFEHQCVQCHLHLLVAHVNSRLSYGTGRPAILKDDERI